MTKSAICYDEPPELFDLSLLPGSAKLGNKVQIFASDVKFGDNVVIGDGVVIVGDTITIGRDVSIGSDSNLRAGSLCIGDRSEIHSKVSVLVAEDFSLGEATRVAKNVGVLCRSFTAGRLFYLGDGSNIGYGGTTTSTALVRIGNRVTIGQHAILNANCPTEIGDNVGTGSYLAIWTHGYHFGHGPLDGSEPTFAPVRIGNNVWLGFHVTILPGVSIGDNTIVGAGAVVTSDIPPNVLAGGVPARVKKQIHRRFVVGPEAYGAVAKVLEVWQRELSWKGCEVELVRNDSNYVEMVASLADGSERTRVVFAENDDHIPTRCPGESLVILTVDDRPNFQPLDEEQITVFVLRAGEMRGRSTRIIEDLRDQLRRHAMPCGDTSCFSSIEPRLFARLRAATERKA